jgi:hypothetical protein
MAERTQEETLADLSEDAREALINSLLQAKQSLLSRADLPVRKDKENSM